MNTPFEDDTILARWLSGELTEAERQALERHPDFPEFRRLVEATDRLRLPDAAVPAMWEKLSQKIAEQPEKQPVARRRMIWWAAAAAVLIGLLVVAWPFLQAGETAPTLVSTGVGEQKTVRLPDGSTARLNAGSSLKIFARDWDATRRLELDGEALFEVRKNQAAPFTVDSRNGSVTVLGTVFSVKTRQNTFEVACYEGAVKAISRDASEQVIRAGQQVAARYGKQDWLPVAPLAESTPAWTGGQSRFDNIPLAEVLDELERQYGVQVEFQDAGDRRYSGAFPHNNLDLALRLVCEPLDLNFRVEGKVIHIQSK